MNSECLEQEMKVENKESLLMMNDNGFTNPIISQWHVDCLSDLRHFLISLRFIDMLLNSQISN